MAHAHAVEAGSATTTHLRAPPPKGAHKSTTGSGSRLIAGRRGSALFTREIYPVNSPVIPVAPLSRIHSFTRPSTPSSSSFSSSSTIWGDTGMQTGTQAERERESERELGEGANTQIRRGSSFVSLPLQNAKQKQQRPQTACPVTSSRRVSLSRDTNASLHKLPDCSQSLAQNTLSRPTTAASSSVSRRPSLRDLTLGSVPSTPGGYTPGTDTSTYSGVHDFGVRTPIRQSQVAAVKQAWAGGATEAADRGSGQKGSERGSERGSVSVGGKSVRKEEQENRRPSSSSFAQTMLPS